MTDLQDHPLKRAPEGELIDSHRRYAALVHSIDGIVWEAEAETFRFTFVSDRAEQILGYPARRWLEEPDFWVTHLHPDDRNWAVGFCLNATGRREDHQFEYRMIAADGRAVWLRDYVTVVARDGCAARLCGVMVDVTERKRAEEAARESEARLFAFMDALPLGVFVVDSRGRPYYANRRAEELLGEGIAPELGPGRMAELYGAYVAGTDRPYPEGRMPVVRALSGERVTVEDMEIRRGGRATPLQVSAAPIYGDGGEIAFAVAAFSDITERRQAEEQLRQAQKLESVGRLAGGVAHDFNNLLTAVMGYADLTMRRLDKADPLFRNVEQIRQVAERAAALTRQLLAFSRRQVLQPKVISLNSVISEMEKMLRRLIGEDIDLRTRSEEGLGHVSADPGQIEQVIRASIAERFKGDSGGGAG